MSLGAVVNPYQPIVGLTGIGLNGGFLYIGVDGSDPQTSPQACYWDEAGAIPALQPVDILGGYPMRLGTPARLYTADTYSIRVRDRQGQQVFYEAHAVPAVTPTGVYATRTAAAAAIIPSAMHAQGLIINGFYAVGDGGGGRYRYAPVQAGGAGKFQSTDGAWWELAELEVNVRQFGAKGDGVTDDTTTFQAAATFGAASVTVPPGAFLVSQVTISTVGQSWWIAGGATVTLKSGANSPILHATAADVTVSGGGVLDGNRTAQTRAQFIGVVQGLGASAMTVDGSAGLWIKNAQGAAVYLIDCNGCSVRNVYASATDLMAIFVATTNGTAIADVEVSGNRVDRSMDTAGLLQCGILVQPNPGGAISEYRVRGNRVKMPTTSLVAGNVSIAVRATDGVCEGNQTRGGYMGLSIDTATDVAVCGNSCLAFTKYGIELPGSSRCAVSGNTLVGPGTGTGAWGIIMDGAGTSPTQNTITGNMISGVDYGAGSSGVTAAPRNVFVGNNILFGLAGIYLTTADECVVSGNILKGALGTGDCVFANKSDKLAMVGNSCRTAGTMLNFFDNVATTQTHTICNSNMRQGVGNVFAFTGSRTAGASCSARNNSSGSDYIDIANNIIEVTSGANPTGAVTAGVGSRFYNTFGGAGLTFFVKETGTGTAGWVGK